MRAVVVQPRKDTPFFAIDLILPEEEMSNWKSSPKVQNMVRNQIIYHVNNSLVFNVIILDLEMLQRESLVEGQSTLPIQKIDLSSLPVGDLGVPSVMIEEVP